MLTDVVRDLRTDTASILRVTGEVITQPRAFARSRDFGSKEEFKAAIKFFLFWAGVGSFVITVNSAVTGLSVYTNRVDGVVSLLGPLFGLLVAVLFYPLFRLFSRRLTFGAFLSASCYGSALAIFSITFNTFLSVYYLLRDDIAARMQDIASGKIQGLPESDICSIYYQSFSCFHSLIFAENPLLYIPSILILLLWLFVHSSLLKGGFNFPYWKYVLVWIVAYVSSFALVVSIGILTAL